MPTVPVETGTDPSAAVAELLKLDGAGFDAKELASIVAAAGLLSGAFVVAIIAGNVIGEAIARKRERQAAAEFLRFAAATRPHRLERQARERELANECDADTMPRAEVPHGS